jgi:hypothetical protein
MSSIVEEKSKIYLICDFKSEEFFDELKKAINGKLVYHEKYNKYLICVEGKWSECTYKDSIDFMSSKFKKQLINHKYSDDTSEKEKNKIDNTIVIWTAGNIDKDDILKKIITGNTIDDKFLSGIGIKIDNSSIEKITIKVSYTDDYKYESIGKLKIISVKISEFLKEYTVQTEDLKDTISTKDLYDKYIIWCTEKKLEIPNNRVFGRGIKILNLEKKNTSTGLKYLKLKFNKF